MANVGDPAATAVSSAANWKQMRQAMDIAQKQSNMDLAVKSQNMATSAAAQLAAEAGARETGLRADLIAATTPSTIEKAKAEARLQTLLLPGAQNTADLEKMMGATRPGISSAAQLAKVLDTITRLFKR